MSAAVAVAENPVGAGLVIHGADLWRHCEASVTLRSSISCSTVAWPVRGELERLGTRGSTNAISWRAHQSRVDRFRGGIN